MQCILVGIPAVNQNRLKDCRLGMVEIHSVSDDFSERLEAPTPDPGHHIPFHTIDCSIIAPNGIRLPPKSPHLVALISDGGSAMRLACRSLAELRSFVRNVLPHTVAVQGALDEPTACLHQLLRRDARLAI
jgi:hypothetical protein